MRYWLVGLVMMFALAGQAPADELIVSGKTYHFRDNHKYNNENAGLWYLRERDGLLVGAYINSYDDPVAAAGKVWRTGQKGDTFRFGALAGAAVGYHNAAITPAVGVVAKTGPLETMVTPATVTVAVTVEF